MALPEQYWVPFTAYKLEADVADWWNSIMSTKGRNLSWMEFLRIFRELYFLIRLVNEKRLKFEIIRQGNQSIAEYLNQFTHLLRYAGNFSDEDKGMKFLYGMR